MDILLIFEIVKNASKIVAVYGTYRNAKAIKFLGEMAVTGVVSGVIDEKIDAWCDKKLKEYEVK